MCVPAPEFSNVGPFRAVYFDGPQPDRDHEGEEVPVWVDRPARTIITAEGGATPSRFKHVVQMTDGRYRRLMPVELERINAFLDNHTKLGDIIGTKRAFFLGNALEIEVVTRLGHSLVRAIETP
jgi:DNA (cytosine-5)-methyltransferase 1